MSQTTKYQGMALITGASTGIGAIYAKRLAARGYDLILVARNQQRLDDVAASIRQQTGREVQVLVADLTNNADLQKVETVLKDDTSITLLVNNAGFGGAGPLLNSDINKMQEMITLNISALTQLTYAAAPAFVARKQGAIINIASIVAISPETLNGVYGASKAYVLALSLSLNHELADKGVRIQAVLPGATATEFWDVAGLPVDNLPKDWVMSADNLVDAALAGFDQGELVTIPSLHNVADWHTYEAARQDMRSRLSNTQPAARYSI